MMSEVNTPEMTEYVIDIPERVVSDRSCNFWNFFFMYIFIVILIIVIFIMIYVAVTDPFDYV